VPSTGGGVHSTILHYWLDDSRSVILSEAKDPCNAQRHEQILRPANNAALRMTIIKMSILE